MSKRPTLEQALQQHALLQKKLLKQYASGRQVVHYPETNQVNQKSGVVRRTEVLPKQLLVTGTGRCGSTHVSALLTAAGFDVPHERCGALGTSSLYFCVDSDWHPFAPFDPTGHIHVGERASDYFFKHIVHVVRHPLPTIASIAQVFEKLGYEYFMDNGVIPKVSTSNKLSLAMYLYYGVNHHIEFMLLPRLRICIEDIEKEWPRLLKAAEFPRVPLPYLQPSNTRSDVSRVRNSFTETEKLLREHWQEKTQPARLEFSWRDLDATDYRLASCIKDMAKRYGYEV